MQDQGASMVGSGGSPASGLQITAFSSLPHVAERDA